MKLGVVVNPYAGKGVDERLVRKVVEKLGEVKLVAQEELGEVYFKEAEVVRIRRTFTGEDTKEIVKLMDGKVDLIVVFGGDGTASDAASAKPKTPLLCIGTGTTNVGKLITPPDFDPERLKVVELDALRVIETDRLAFNDVVAGNTILATINGKVTQIDAERFMKGEKVRAEPKKFRGKIKAGGKIIEGVFGNVFVNLTSKEFLGKGSAGGLAMAAFVGFPAVVSSVNEPLVVAEYTKEKLREVEPIVTQTVSLDYNEKVTIEANTVISADGNPQTYGKATVEVLEKAVRVLKEKRKKF
ncbi:ATP-NAD/AcoX kinase [Ferroglobus placidus DSM 10642]|uniref:ATP-NAD/AcoX kinase n=1 Tax=Ferroglobus placidus (strain DSM 10642 / AEDII12DO) TaxID=589924 RepID=D3S011_FERPA|nr:diacylglycerol kinase family protein [Ferroglobus placidus]ADC66074.1 ATP-NAD/AcoX kinase [Ferroglobus placidus DSM 10642]